MSALPKRISFLRIPLIVLGLWALFGVGLGIRRQVLEAQYAQYGRAMPFNLESALEFRYVKMLYNTGFLPVVDTKIEPPQGIRVFETYTIGAEYVYAGVAHCLPSNWSLEDRVRWVAAGWYCLGIVFMSLWVGWKTGSYWAAGLAGAYYAVSLSSVGRSTGQELSHENFALPWLLAHLALAACAQRQVRLAGFVGVTALSAVALMMALCTWDLVQFYLLIWMGLSVWRWVFQSEGFGSTRARLAWLIPWLALLAAGGLHPYLRAHGFLASYLMLASYGLAAGLLYREAAAQGWLPERWGPPGPRARSRWGGRGWRALWVVLPWAVGLGLCSAYADTYQHFLELLWAKLRFLNQKPADPALLTFSQRILWTPALTSANILLTLTLFPAIVFLILLAFVILLCQARWRSDPDFILIVLGCCISFFAFLLFVRLHVFVAVFASALIGCLAAESARWRPVSAACLLMLLLAGVGVEAANVLRDPWRWGSVPAYGPQKMDVADWLKRNTQNETVLANFGLSAFLLAYGDCGIVLHPKFETPEARRRVQGYAETLFKGDETEFRDWADTLGARYYVHALGEFAREKPEWQMRYMANALQPSTHSAAWKLEFTPQQCRYFVPAWENGKYRIYWIITRQDERGAALAAAKALAALQQGQLETAQDKAALALHHDPQSRQAMDVLLMVESLRQKGVRE